MIKKISSSFNANILVAEDYPLSQIFIKKILEKMGCKVQLASSGKEFLSIIETGNFDLIFMDLHFPGLDGFQLTAEIRKKKEFADTPIIALTADALAGVKERCLEAGMNDFLLKPVKGNEIEDILLKYLK